MVFWRVSKPCVVGCIFLVQHKNVVKCVRMALFENFIQKPVLSVVGLKADSLDIRWDVRSILIREIHSDVGVSDKLPFQYSRIPNSIAIGKLNAIANRIFFVIFSQRNVNRAVATHLLKGGWGYPAVLHPAFRKGRTICPANGGDQNAEQARFDQCNLAGVIYTVGLDSPSGFNEGWLFQKIKGRSLHRLAWAGSKRNWHCM